MIHCSRPLDRFQQCQARGFTLIELMVSVTIALFLIGGALAIVGRTRSTFVAQNQLAQLQDNERLALTLMAEVIESGGYFPAPQTNQASTMLPPVTGTFVAGQAIYGTSAPDKVSIRFATATPDNVYGCTGVQSTTAAPDTYTNLFSVDNSKAQLMCTFTNAAGTVGPVALVNGVTNLVVLYGVRKSTTNTGSCTDTYLTATQVGASPGGDWLNVCSVKVRITFTNPIITTAGATTGTPIIIERVIAVMTTVGVNS